MPVHVTYGTLNSAHFVHANTQSFPHTNTQSFRNQIQSIVTVATYVSINQCHCRPYPTYCLLYFLFDIRTKEKLVKLRMHYGLKCL